MTIIGILGAIGSGKSHAQLKQGLLYADQRHKQLVCNFLVDEKAIYKYACLPAFSEKVWGGIFMEIINFKYAIQWHLSKIFKFIPKPNKQRFKPRLPWIKRMIEGGGGIIQIPNPKNLQALLIPESVVLLDEAGILLNAREFAKTPKELLADLAQSRKFGSDLIWCAQFDSQIDRQMRMLTQYFWHCKGGSIWDKKMRRPKLIYKEMHYFDADNYESWVNNPKARGNWIKTRFAYAIRTEEGVLSRADIMLFGCFDSFSRLDLSNDRNKARIRTIHQCRIRANREYKGTSTKQIKVMKVHLLLTIEAYEMILTEEMRHILIDEGKRRENNNFIKVLDDNAMKIFENNKNW